MQKDVIKLNELFKIDNLGNVKIRFNLMFDGNWNPIEFYKNADFRRLLGGQYWNYNRKSFKEGQVTIGFLRLANDDTWLLFHVGKVVKDLHVLNGIGYEYVDLPEYEKYIGRLIIKYKNKSQTMIRLATSVIKDCEVYQILPDSYDDDIFPGYDRVNLSWSQLSRVITKQSWKTYILALETMLFDGTERGTKDEFVTEYGEQPLGVFIRSIVGLDIKAANDAFSDFIQKGNLRADQMTFIKNIISFLEKNGVIDKRMLFEPPFTDINDQGLLGVFDDASATKIISIVDEINGNAVVA